MKLKQAAIINQYHFLMYIKTGDKKHLKKVKKDK